MSSPSFELLKHAWLAVLALLTHAFVGAVAVTASYALEHYILWLHDGREPLLFGRIPLRYILEGGDAALLVGVLIFGTIAAINTLRRHG